MELLAVVVTTVAMPPPCRVWFPRGNVRQQSAAPWAALDPPGPSGWDSVGLTCPLCPHKIWAGMCPPHTKGPREPREFLWGTGGETCFGPTQVAQVMSVKNKKRHYLRLTTHADVASFNAAAKHINSMINKTYFLYIRAAKAAIWPRPVSVLQNPRVRHP